MTEGLPWDSPGTSSETAAPPQRQGGRRAARQATLVGDREPAWPADAWDEGEWVLTKPTAESASQTSAESEGNEAADDPPSPRMPWPESASSGEQASAYTGRRHLRETATVPPVPSDREDDVFGPAPAFAPAHHREPQGPSTAELELYRPSPSGVPPAPGPERVPGLSGARLPDESPFPVDTRPAGTLHGRRVRRFVERWSRWVAGLGLPPRDPRGGRRYVERLFPPAVWLIAALGVAVFVGLLTGILVSSPGAGAGTVHTAVATTTVTVTNAQTTTATATVTRTKTHTVTVSPQVQNTGQNVVPTAPPNSQNGGQGLGPGSQGAQVFLLQQALARLGFFAGPPTGVYDAQTQAAVQNFQARAGITADPPGVAGPTTLQALRQALGQ